MFFQDVFPTLLVEVLHIIKDAHMAIDQYLCCVNFFPRHNFPDKILLDEELQTEPTDLGKLSSSRLKVRVHSSCFGGVLAPMRCLVRVAE